MKIFCERAFLLVCNYDIEQASRKPFLVCANEEYDGSVESCLLVPGTCCQREVRGHVNTGFRLIHHDSITECCDLHRFLLFFIDFQGQSTH